MMRYVLDGCLVGYKKEKRPSEVFFVFICKRGIKVILVLFGNGWF